MKIEVGTLIRDAMADSSDDVATAQARYAYKAPPHSPATPSGAVASLPHALRA